MITGLRRAGAVIAATLVLVTSTAAPAGAEQVGEDPTFNGGEMVVFDIAGDADVATATVLQPDGRIIVVGHSMIDGDFDALAFRVLPTGGLDTGFAEGGFWFFDSGNGGHDQATDVALDPQGRIIVAGVFGGTPGLFRLTSSGDVDTSFGTFGTGSVAVGGFSQPEVIVDSDGGVVVAHGVSSGSTNQQDLHVTQLEPNGTPDTGFGVGGTFTLDTGSTSSRSIWEEGRAIVRMADGRLVVVAKRAPGSEPVDTLVVRLTSGGALDTSFGGGVGWRAYDLSRSGGWDEGADALIQGSSILVGARMYNGASTMAKIVVVRLDSSGNIDAGFGNSGLATYQSSFGPGNEQPTWLTSMALDAAGRILVAGSGWGEVAPSSLTDHLVVRFSPNGQLDGSFGGGRHATDTYGSYDEVHGMVVQPDGRLVLVGLGYVNTQYTSTGQYDTDITVERWSFSPDPPPPPPPPAPPPPHAPPPHAPPPPPPDRSGYWMVTTTGEVYSFGHSAWFGNAPVARRVAVDLERTATSRGYWIVDDLGHVFSFGDAAWHGNGTALAPGEVVTSLSRTASGGGYWIFTSRGRVIARGDAPFLGDMSGVRLNGPVLDSVPTPTGAGYYMVASDGGVFTFGDAQFAGSMGDTRLNAPVQSLVPDADNAGYWLVASDGGIFAFEAAFLGSMGSTTLNRPVTGMVASSSGAGYLMVAEDGGIFTFGDVAFHGSLGSSPPSTPITSVAAAGA